MTVIDVSFLDNNITILPYTLPPNVDHLVLKLTPYSILGSSLWTHLSIDL